MRDKMKKKKVKEPTIAHAIVFEPLEEETAEYKIKKLQERVAELSQQVFADVYSLGQDVQDLLDHSGLSQKRHVAMLMRHLSYLEEKDEAQQCFNLSKGHPDRRRMRPDDLIK